MISQKPIVRLLVSFILLTAWIDSPVYSQPDAISSDSIYYHNPEKFIAQKVLENKIVMLADAGHHDFYVYGTLLKVLYALAEEVSGTNGKTSLTLILEMSAEDAGVLSGYVTTGDSGEIIDKILPFLHYEDLEYYSNLRKYYNHISEEKFSGKLDFVIAGFEPMKTNPTIEMIKMSEWQTDSAFFVRDSILSLRISDYANKYPDSKILIFYGSGHLQKGLSPKSTNYGTHGESYGYYMADYLKRLYDDERVSTFNQKWLPPEYFKGTAYTEAENYDIVTNGRIADTAQFPWAAQYDHMIFWKDTSNWEPPHRFELVFSRRNVDKYIEELKYLNQFIENEQVKQYINVPVFYINLITCNEFKTPDEAIHWDGLNNYDGYNVMFSDCFKMKIYEAWAHSKTKSLARMLGFIPKDLEIIDGTDTLKRFEEIWEANLKSIMFMNSIGIMWMGYADEQKQAKKYLMNYSGKDFDNSEDYFDWWRKQQTE